MGSVFNCRQYVSLQQLGIWWWESVGIATGDSAGIWVPESSPYALAQCSQLSHCWQSLEPSLHMSFTLKHTVFCIQTCSLALAPGANLSSRDCGWLSLSLPFLKTHQNSLLPSVMGNIKGPSNGDRHMGPFQGQCFCQPCASLALYKGVNWKITQTRARRPCTSP